ncbi:MAG: GNAT family N-acetyltransferase [Actinomycetaceae bacterium]|nr:GNAT family N-acetyltransferase [Actinomycetaceae bacterium]
MSSPRLGYPVELRLMRLRDMSPLQVHDLYRLRVDVFVTEQRCAFEFDDLDPNPGTIHVVAQEGERTIGTARVYVDEQGRARIGRVAVAADRRKYGIGRLVMQAAVDYWEPQIAIFIEAQAYLREWYETFGFQVDGDMFLEAGIEHYPMTRPGA